MAKKIEITQKQFADMLKMYAALKLISKDFMTPDQLRKSAEKDYGLDFEELLEMSYDNMKTEAKWALKGVKIPKILS